jgi:hypothetical protein
MAEDLGTFHGMAEGFDAIQSTEGTLLLHIKRTIYQTDACHSPLSSTVNWWFIILIVLVTG